jgi:hypothetical protein
MSRLTSFTPTAPTGYLQGKTAPVASDAVKVVNAPYAGYLISIAGTNDCWVGYGGTAFEAAANAVIPTAGNPTQCIFCMARTQQPLEHSQNLWFCAITQTGTSDIYITPGEGV